MFLRNDIFELLVGATPDRGMESKVVLDWTDEDLLREMLRRRLVYGDAVQDNTLFEDVWRAIAVSYVDGEESSQFVMGAFPISRSRAHTHRRHGHPLQTVPSAGLIERPQEKNRVDALR